VSAFLVSDEVDAVAILADTAWDHYGLTTAGAQRAAGHEIIGTDIENEDELIPHSDRHIDLVVGGLLGSMQAPRPSFACCSFA
jgi:hypothetical protein